jgi:hypothetical protein
VGRFFDLKMINWELKSLFPQKFHSNEKFTIYFFNHYFIFLGFSDFVIETYGTSGCCLKRTDFVWIYDAKNHRFNMAYDFLNPEYFPKIKTMISLSYGHPNEVHYCQMKWRANKLDTVEFIYKNGKKYVLERKVNNKIQIDTIPYRNIPKIYKKSDNFAWFDDRLH